MAEWPKVWDLTPVGPSVRVIPADLGWDLYQALHRANETPAAALSGEAFEALARYEQEVGS